MSTARISTILPIAAVALSIILASLFVSAMSDSATAGYEETNRIAAHEQGLTLRSALVTGAVTGGREIVTRNDDVFALPDATTNHPSRVTVAVGLAIGLVVSFTLIFLIYTMFPRQVERILQKIQVDRS